MPPLSLQIAFYNRHRGEISSLKQFFHPKKKNTELGVYILLI